MLPVVRVSTRSAINRSAIAGRVTLVARIYLTLAIAVVAAAPAFAGPLKKSEVPESLRPWVNWVMTGHEEALCPFFPGEEAGAGEKIAAETPAGESTSGETTSDAATPDAAAEGVLRRACVWPARLELTIDDRSARFAQDWQVFREAWVPLPGETRFWPQGVTADGRAVVVEPRDGAPGLTLGAGRHRVAGRIEWETPPPLLHIPAATGLLRLTVRGREVPFPVRDAEGAVWLQKQSGPEEESRVDLVVHRQVDDDVPLVLTTRLELRVSGRSREILFGRALPDGFVPMYVRGPLPARIEPSGRLLVQARPGTWLLAIGARHTGPVTALARPAPEGPWADDEVWVFQSRPALRQVVLSGAAAVDPQQTTLPGEWRALPAYLVKQSDTLRLEEKQRGDADPAPDRLEIERAMWLDFNGGGWTIHDHVTGSFARSWRLEMPEPAVLGRVAIDDADQVITRRETSAPPGFEIRQGQANIEADSRVPGRPGTMPALGWSADFAQAAGHVFLPPGWRLLHATGVDDVDATWVSAWTLLDIFLVLIVTLAAARLWGRRFGILAVVALGLSWIEVGAPRRSWVVVLVTAALVTALPDGRLRRAAKVLHVAAVVVLVSALVPFLVMQARTAMYPGLEQPMAMAAEAAQVGQAGAGGALQYMAGDGAVVENLRSLGYIGSNAPSALPPPPPPPAKLTKEAFISSNLAPDPKMSAQTGPGLPMWSWRRVDLTWRGPVGKEQTLRLFLLPPFMGTILCWMRIALLAALAVGMILVGLGGRGLGGRLARPLFGASPAAAVFVLALASVLGAGALGAAAAGATPAQAAEFPPKEMLDTLRTRLLQPPDCGDECLSCPRMALEATPSMLRLRLEIHAAAAVAAPLPGGADMWVPARVLLDGAPAPGLLHGTDGRLWISLAEGTHQVLMEGPLADRESIPLPLPLLPGRVTAQAQGWRVDGLQDGRAEETLQLARLRARGGGQRGGGGRGGGAGGGDAGGLEPGTLPPFVRVERALEIGLRWEVRTRVTRLTPAGTAILIEVPLLAGEAVTSPDVRVRDGRAIVGLSPDGAEAGWTSVIETGDTIRLRAPDGVPWTEVWRVTASPVWHVQPEGIPPVHPGETPALRSFEWRPWPGETVTLGVTRPAPIDGRTLTIDSSLLTLSPGLRMADATLELRLRASRGGEHTLTLPPGSALQSVRIDMAPQPIRQDGDRVVLPITPGRHAMQVVWRDERAIRMLLRAPEVDLGAETVNANVTVSMPGDHWTLFAGGPRLGPAVLFWSFLTIALLASFGLGATGITPLRWYHWFLLSLGLTQVPLWTSIVIAGWLLVLGVRGRRAPAHPVAFDGLQILIVAWSLVAGVLLFWAIEHGLLGMPQMQISGNGSSASSLQWYVDRTDGKLPRPWVISVPLFVYRLAMLAWALWLAAALVRWLRWGWERFNTGGIWLPLRTAREGRKAPPTDAGSPSGAGSPAGGPPPVIGPGGSPEPSPAAPAP